MATELSKRHKHINQLIENKISFCADDAQLSVYDTYAQASAVPLSSDNLLFCGMLTGKKVMHVDDCDYHHDFLPNQSFVLAPKQQVLIDFPDAQMHTPTTCLAIEISTDKINDVAERLNLTKPENIQEVNYHSQLVHTEHNWQTQNLLNRLTQLFSENESQRGYLIDLALNELITRLLDQQSRDFLLKCSEKNPEENAFTRVIEKIERSLHSHIEIEELCKLACMSRSKFYAAFKSAMGMTPQQWHLARRLNQAKCQLLKGNSVTQVGFDLGFNHISQFSRAFKNAYGITPKAFQQAKLLKN